MLNQFYFTASLFFLVASCTNHSKPLEIKVSSHNLRESGAIHFKLDVSNSSQKTNYILEPRAGSAAQNIEPQAFCIASETKHGLKETDSYKKAFKIFQKNLIFREIRTTSTSATSNDFIEISPGEKKEMESLLYISGPRLDSGTYYAKCYYHFSKNDIESANSTEAKDFLRKMEPMTLETPIYRFEVPDPG